MPIRKENRDRYPASWREISARIRNERAQGQCECEGECGHDHYGRCPAENGGRDPISGNRVVLTVAHLDHVPENCDDDNLRAFCQRCHNAYDAPERARGRMERHRAAMALGDLFKKR